MSVLNLNAELQDRHRSAGFRVKAVVVHHPKLGRGFTWYCSICGKGEGHWSRYRDDVRAAHAEHVGSKW